MGGGAAKGQTKRHATRDSNTRSVQSAVCALLRSGWKLGRGGWPRTAIHATVLFPPAASRVVRTLSHSLHVKKKVFPVAWLVTSTCMRCHADDTPALSWRMTIF
eukprot:360753-Chlamydomonas_euryale.AAC.10